MTAARTARHSKKGARTSRGSTARDPNASASKVRNPKSRGPKPGGRTIAASQGRPEADSTPARASILVADDNADMRAYICGLLTSAGYTATGVENGEQAWSACTEGRPDLVIADAMMPGLSGFELLERIRSDARTEDVPVMLVSALPNEQFRMEVARRGGADYLIKPFHGGELVARAEAVLVRAAERKRSEAELRQAAAVFSGTNEAVIIADPQYRIVAVNAAFSRLSGFSAAEVIGKNPNIQKSGRHDAAFYQNLWQTIHAAGSWEGQIWNRRKNGEIYPCWENISAVRDEQGSVSSYVAVFSDIGSIKATEERLAYMAHHDALTDLPNRLLFTARLEQALEHGKRHKRRVALLLLDLDRFKLINDTLGHSAGDELLRAVAVRLKKSVRAEDTVARLGGDEFAIILDELGKPEEAAMIARKILKRVNAPAWVGGKNLIVSSSIGISIFPQDARNSSDLIKAADAAMYAAKQKGRHAFGFYTPEVTAEAAERLGLEMDLPQALAKRQFTLNYQPQVELATGRVLGVEALIRWNHPTRGLVLPGRFIPIAEENGLIVPIGEWLIREAVRKATSWAAAGLPPLQMAINLSDRQLVLDHVPSTVKEALRKADRSGQRVRLVCEVTEDMLTESSHCVPALRSLRELGVGIAVDDFGTGYSSLSRLKALPVDALKIDSSFVRDLPANPDHRSIAAAIISLGHELGFKVIAEGVETSEQLEILRATGCDAAQGYFLCKPVPPDELARFLIDSRRH